MFHDAKAVEQFFKSLDALHAKPEVKDVGGIPYLIYKDTSCDLRRQDEPQATPLQMTTLGSLAEYWKVFDPEAEHSMFQVVWPSRVDLISLERCGAPVRDYHDTYAIAEFLPSGKFGTWMTPDDFAIWVLSEFVQTDVSRELLSATAGIKHEAVQTVESKDTGVAQQVVVSAGVSIKGQAIIKPLWDLRPYRTFREIPQPESAFLLRMRGGGDGKPPNIALFEADGGRWKQDAMESIKSYLTEKAAGAVILL